MQRRLAKDLISMWIWILSQIGQCSPYLGNVFGLVSQLYHQAVHCHVPLPWPLFCSRCCLAERKSGCTLSPGLSFAGSSDSLLGSLFPAGSSPYLVEKGAAGVEIQWFTFRWGSVVVPDWLLWSLRGEEALAGGAVKVRSLEGPGPTRTALVCLETSSSVPGTAAPLKEQNHRIIWVGRDRKKK